VKFTPVLDLLRGAEEPHLAQLTSEWTLVFLDIDNLTVVRPAVVEKTWMRKKTLSAQLTDVSVLAGVLLPVPPKVARLVEGTSADFTLVGLQAGM